MAIFSPKARRMIELAVAGLPDISTASSGSRVAFACRGIAASRRCSLRGSKRR